MTKAKREKTYWAITDEKGKLVDNGWHIYVFKTQQDARSHRLEDSKEKVVRVRVTVIE